MSKRIVGMEQATAIGKLRVEFEGGRYAYLTPEQVSEAIYQYLNREAEAAK